MLIDYLSSKGISIYRLSKESHVPYSTLNDLVNHKLPVENIRSGQLKSLADVLNVDMNTLYDMCQIKEIIQSERYDVQASISIEHKSYYLNFDRYGQSFKHKLLPVKKESSTYLDILAKWKLDELLDQLEMEAAYETLCSQTT